jgi:hypothetical protein
MPDTSSIRNKTRRIKDHISDRFLGFVDKLEKGKGLDEFERKRYEELTDVFAKSVVPRTQELTGEDGEKLIIPIYGGLSEHPSNQEDIQPETENTGS